MWVLEIVDVLTGHRLDGLGIQPRVISELPQIFTAPLLHFGWAHLISNSIPFLVLGVIILLGGLRHWVVATLASVIGSGLLVWLISPPGSVTAGASGVIFGYLTYLLVRGFISHNLGQIAIAVGVFVLYGGVLWGVLPFSVGVSWQAHLGGALGGIAAAWLLHRSPDRRTVPQLNRRS
ncbi:rhomboid family intramembrane serine protease [Nigerium massiliense]|uniref:rhomboid family intramembrane serine protease n=1 Tax=Nigerium massiliense TaxID=1522317 RepID=UPI00069463F6|nr:rhomboid family intramembrane serine protease [Nigerium massiliense]